MIGVDADIPLRPWLDDDAVQNKHIDALLAAQGGMPGSLPVTHVVLVEAVWTLNSAFNRTGPPG